MDLTTAMKLFVRVVETGSLTQAGRELVLAPSSVTRQINALEDELGVRLLHRTTRRVSPTEPGRLYYQDAKRILAQIEQAHQDIAAHRSKPAGLLRVTAPITLGHRRIAPLLGGFMRKYPEIRVHLTLTDSMSDLVEERMDVAIRVGTHEGANLVARKLISMRRALCASPAYLKKAGKPRTPSDLPAHQCITFDYGPGSELWYLIDKRGKAQEIALSSRLHTTSTDAIHEAVLAGVGICVLPHWMVEADLKRGRLVELLPEYRADLSPEPDQWIHAMYFHRNPAPKVRVFIDYLVEALATVP